MSELRKVQHKFLNHKINPETETLIIGTFNPKADSNKDTDFFYSSAPNNLWALLPAAFGGESLKGAGLKKKLSLMQEKRIDFIDLISEVQVEKGKEGSRDDTYIDNKVLKWKDLIDEIDKLRDLKRVCFTRTSFGRIPNIKKRIEEIYRYLKERRDIDLKCLITPVGTGRRAGPQRQQEVWQKFLCS